MACTTQEDDMATATMQPGTGSPDFKKLLAPLFNPPRDPVLVDVPDLGYLMVDGKGAPEEGADAPPADAPAGPRATEFQKALQALYSAAYTMKFSLKRDGAIVPVMPLQALWFTADDLSFDVQLPMAEWRWRAMMAVPDVITPAIFEAAVEEIRRKKGDAIALNGLRFERWTEGRCAQVMHIGPYSAEPPTIERLHEFVRAQGLRLRGAHHEIYLGDPRRAEPAKLKTVLRHGVE
jgi:hypothetical protein